jgi:hypothetical protein
MGTSYNHSQYQGRSAPVRLITRDSWALRNLAQKERPEAQPKNAGKIANVQSNDED